MTSQSQSQQHARPHNITLQPVCRAVTDCTAAGSPNRRTCERNSLVMMVLVRGPPMASTVASRCGTAGGAG